MIYQGTIEKFVGSIYMHGFNELSIQKAHRGQFGEGPVELPSTRPNPAKPRPGIEPMNL